MSFRPLLCHSERNAVESKNLPDYYFQCHFDHSGEISIRFLAVPLRGRCHVVTEGVFCHFREQVDIIRRAVLNFIHVFDIIAIQS